MFSNAKNVYVALACGVLTLMTACGPVTRDAAQNGDKNGAGDGSLFRKGKIQETILTFHGLSQELPSHPTAGRPILATIALAIGGDSHSTGGSAWQALAASFTTSEVEGHGGDTGALYLDDAGIVSFARDGGEAVKVGSMQEAIPEYPIDLQDGVKAQLLVDGQPSRTGQGQQDLRRARAWRSKFPESSWKRYSG